MRGPKARIRWFLHNSPGGVGWCARHTYRSLGSGVPALGAADANAVVAWARKSGHLHTGRRKNHPPKGAIVLWTSKRHGHMALSMGDGHVASTDVSGGNTTGVVDLDWPRRHWGHHYVGWVQVYGSKKILKGAKR